MRKAGALIEVLEDAKSILKATYETAKGLHKAGTLDAMTMREFDALRLPLVSARYDNLRLPEYYQCGAFSGTSAQTRLAASIRFPSSPWNEWKQATVSHH